MELAFKEGWSNFTRRIFINKNVSVVYKAWAQSAELEKWFFESADYIDEEGNKLGKTSNVHAGASCEWKWYGWPHLHTGKILEAKLDTSLKFEFSPGGNVFIEFVEIDAERTELVLHQSEIPNENEQDIKYFFYGCSLGWSFWMLNLKAFLEHGILLNEKSNPYKDDPRKLEVVNQ